MEKLLSILFLVGASYAYPQQELQNSLDRTNPAPSSGNVCSDGVFSAICLKIEAISMLEKLSAKEELTLLPGISVVKEAGVNETSEHVAAELAKALPGKREERVDKYLLHRLGTYLDTHSVKFRLLGSEDEGGSAGEARKKDKKGGGMNGLMAAGLMMKGTLMSIGMGGLAMLAGKALMTALMSLMLSAIIGLKSLTSGGGKSTTYEIVTKPVYSHSHSHSTGHEDVGYGHSGHGSY